MRRESIICWEDLLDGTLDDGGVVGNCANAAPRDQLEVSFFTPKLTYSATSIDMIMAVLRVNGLPKNMRFILRFADILYVQMSTIFTGG